MFPDNIALNAIGYDGDFGSYYVSIWEGWINNSTAWFRYDFDGYITIGYLGTMLSPTIPSTATFYKENIH